MVEDITEQKRVRERLLQLSRAVEQSPAMVVITDTRGVIQYVNPKFTEVTGYAAEEVLGKNPRVPKSGKQDDAFYQDLWRTIAAGQEWRGEFQNRRKNGEVYWEYASISPVRAADGAVTHYLAVKEDITERKRADEALRQSEQRLALHIQETPLGVIEWDTEFRVKAWNAAAEAIFGCSAAEALGQHSSFIIPERFRPQVDGVWQELLSSRGGRRTPSRMACFAARRRDPPSRSSDRRTT